MPIMTDRTSGCQPTNRDRPDVQAIPCRRLPEDAKDAVQDPAVLVVADLVRRVEAHPGLELHGIGAVARCGHLDGLRLAVLQVADLDHLLAVEAERLDGLA